MTSRLAQMQARFQQKQMQEKEEKLLKLYENQQQRTIERVSRGSAGSDGSITTTTTVTSTTQGGKVRQMFDERRQKAGIDRSYPLEPLRTTKSNGFPGRASNLDRNKNATTKTVAKSTVQKSVSLHLKNGKPVASKRDVTQSVYTNDDGVENYEEHRYEDDNANDFLKRRDDLVTLMNDHNLNESLDDEELPSIEIDEFDEPAFTGKLANVGGKLPSQNGLAGKQVEQRTVGVNGKISTTPTRKETKPTVKKTFPKTQSSPKRSPSTESPQSSQSNTPKASTPSTPNKSIVMSSKKPQQNRVPTVQRPSSRTPKGPHSTVVRDDLEACQFCNRRFASERLQVHEEICAKTAKKRRKTYDALKHRVAGTELEPFVRRGKGAFSKTKTPSSKKSSWRQTHEDFISTIRAAKMAQQHIAKGGKLSDLPPPPPSSNPDYIQCPHCGRKFNQSAAERHIPKCATYEFNKTKNAPRPAAGRGRGPQR